MDSRLRFAGLLPRFPPTSLKAAAEMVSKFTDKNKNKSAEKPKLAATGKKETVNGYETEEYVYEAPDLKATYWIAPLPYQGDQPAYVLDAGVSNYNVFNDFKE